MVEATPLIEGKTYRAADIRKILDAAWAEAEADVIREWMQATCESKREQLHAEMRAITRLKGRTNVRIAQ